MKLFFVGVVAAILLYAAGTVHAADLLVFDSTDNYLGTCQFTDTSSWDLTKDISVSKFQIWYKWNTGETSLPVTVNKDGVPFASFEAKRGDCDPYQTTWCNADFNINKVLPKGTYTTEIPNQRQCLKPGGTGAVRLYSSDTTTTSDSLSPTAAPTSAIQPSSTIAPVTLTNEASTPPTFTCNHASTIVIATALSSILSVGISIVLRKK